MKRGTTTYTPEKAEWAGPDEPRAYCRWVNGQEW